MALTYDDYSICHPWYFLLGGSAPSPRYIRDQVAETGQTGYLTADIDQIDRKPEPQRSTALRELCDKVKAELRKDIARYRECVCDLRRYRETQDPSERPRCAADVHVNLSLKVSHMINGFAHLRQLDSLSRQTDLLDLLG